MTQDSSRYGSLHTLGSWRHLTEGLYPVWHASHRLFDERDAGSLFLAHRESVGHLDMLCDQGRAITRRTGEILICQAA